MCEIGPRSSNVTTGRALSQSAQAYMKGMDGLCVPSQFLQIEEPLKLEFTNEFLMFEVLQNRVSQIFKKVISSIVLKQPHSFCKDKTFLVNQIACAVRKAF